ncbi:MAG: ribose-phosphate pyrophosphokinase [Candidatus Micrarchaeota archaeon]|nr:ribose-phosphate pyrophosphokinase [Candidatus Micrarchaeota archaeon]
MLIVGGSAANGIDDGVAAALGAKVVKIEKKNFPDGEFKIRINADVKGQDVVIVQSLYGPQEKHLLELLFIIDAAKGLGASKVIVVVPYLAYARQNRRFLEGEGISIDTVVKLLNSVGTDGFITVRPHTSEPLKGMTGKVKVVEPVKTFAEAVRKRCQRPLILSPDKGGSEFAVSVAKELGCPSASLDKERDYNTGEVLIKSIIDGSFRDWDVVIVDDVISGGGTIVASSKFSLGNGAKSVGTAAVHMLMAGDARQRIAASGVSWVVGSNTIPCKDIEVVDISPDIAAGIMELLK